jgi:hypothetical protein
MKNSDHAEFTEENALDYFKYYLDGLEWKYYCVADKPVLFCGFNGKDVLWDFDIKAKDNGDGFFHLSVTSFIPNKARPERRAAAVEIISRINWELTHGCFEMKHSDGEIRFRTSIILPGAEITHAIVGYLVYSNISTVDERVSQIMATLYSSKSPESVMKPKEPETAGSQTPTQPRFELN